jgi:Tol biopolymer transport system component
MTRVGRWIGFAALATVLLQACETTAKEAVSVPLITVEPTPTGQGDAELKVTRKPALAYLETIERSPNVSSVTQITNNQDNLVQIGPPVMSPTSDEMVYTVFVEEEGGGSYSNIFLQHLGSPSKTSITTGKWLDLSPCIAPDGESVVFSSNRTNANPTLWRIPLREQGGYAVVTSSNALDFAPSIFPDGVSVAYASLPLAADDRQIWTVAGSFRTQLREGDQPCVSPDGQTIVFMRRDRETKRNQLWVMDTDGSSETQLTANTGYDVLDARWSPDGSWIVFASDQGLDSRKNHNFDIWLIRPDGSSKTQLTTNGSRDDSPCWDRTGESIYFRSNRGGMWNIWRFRPNL